jgi:Domain of unknown function (DUF4422)
MDDALAKIYVFYYKPGSVLNLDKMYQPIMAGNAMMKQTTMPGDNTGENISGKNQYYSELTGIYWVWKNSRQDVVGTCHYRRYFTAQPEPFLYRVKRMFYYPVGLYKKRIGLIYTKNVDLFTPAILTENELQTFLGKYDAILPAARKLKNTGENHYDRYHDIQDLYLIKQIIHEKCPDYLSAYDKVMEGKRLYANNMFVLKNQHFREFMNWWFDLLFEFERRINLSTKTGYQQRNLGFMAERLLNV